MPARFRSYTVPATLVVLAVTVVFAVAGATADRRAVASQVSCGDTVTADTKLDSDLVDCPNHGIVIGADDITLDLNGHRIDGDGTTPATGCRPRREPCDIGVLNDGHDGVTVRHGSVREFSVGVIVGRARHNRLLGISSSGNQNAGVGLFRSRRSVVKNSSGRGSIARDGGVGMFLFESHHMRIVGNSFRHNGDGGIFVGDSTHNLIKANLTSRNMGQGGITLERSDDNQVRRNRSVRDSAIAIYVAPGSRNVIAGNRISHIRSESASRSTAATTTGSCATRSVTPRAPSGLASPR